MYIHIEINESLLDLLNSLLYYEDDIACLDKE